MVSRYAHNEALLSNPAVLPIDNTGKAAMGHLCLQKETGRKCLSDLKDKGVGRVPELKIEKYNTTGSEAVLLVTRPL